MCPLSAVRSPPYGIFGEQAHLPGGLSNVHGRGHGCSPLLGVPPTRLESDRRLRSLGSHTRNATRCGQSSSNPLEDGRSSIPDMPEAMTLRDAAGVLERRRAEASMPVDDVGWRWVRE